MIYRGYTFRLKPTEEQTQKFESFAGVCRLIWNLALDQRLNHWQRFQRCTGNNLNFYTQSAQLKDLRAEFPFIAEVPQNVEVYVFKHLDQAFQGYFKGDKGKPRFKRKGSDDSFTTRGCDVSFEKVNKRWGRIKLPKIGWVKLRLNRLPQGKFTEVTVAKTALGWQVSIGCKWEEDRKAPNGVVGLDRGVKVPVALSDGTQYLLPEQLNVLDRKVRKLQKEASRKKRNSKRQAKAKRRAAQAQAKRARVRKHWAHQMTTDITRRFGTVIIERLRTREMTAKAPKGTIAPNRERKTNLNRMILNVGWNQIKSMLFYKAAKVIKVNPAYSSQTCSKCGTIDNRSRESQAVFSCVHCGFTLHADHNAALVIKHRGSAPVAEFGPVPNVEARTRLVAKAA